MFRTSSKHFVGYTPRQTLNQRKFGLLFFFLLAYLVLYPWTQNAGLRYTGLRVFGIVVTLFSVYAVSFRRTFVLFALVLAVPALIQRIGLPKGDAGALSILSVILTFAFDVFIVVVIFRRVFVKEETTTEAIFGALCIYLLLGFSFAGLYSMLATLQPGAFYLDPAVNLHSVADRFDLIYYSFGTMTSLGAAGITPVSDQARSLSVIEALLGVLYLAVLISRLMSAYQNRRATSARTTVEEALQGPRDD
ncbi:MAG: ion channel [Bryobacteraceae bacterium]